MGGTRMMPMPLMFARLRCKHPNARCVHGDEINHRGGARAACLACGRSLPLERMPQRCYYVGTLHGMHQRDKHSEP